VGEAACAQCHSGPLLTDNDFHNIGVPQEGPFVPQTERLPLRRLM
jgi:cytochrome c peroxidase